MDAKAARTLVKKAYFCEDCNMGVDKTTKHCNRCGVCVERFDHHCVWLNKCIGFSNYKLFLAIVICGFVTMLLQTLYCCVYCFTCLNTLQETGQIVSAMIKVPFGLAYFLLVCSVVFQSISTIILARLLWFHAWLRWNGMTTYEYIVQSKVVPVTNTPKETTLNQIAPQPLENAEAVKSEKSIPEANHCREKYQIVMGKHGQNLSSGRETSFKKPGEAPHPTEADQNVLMTMSNAPLVNGSVNLSLTPGNSPFRGKLPSRDLSQTNLKDSSQHEPRSSISLADEEDMNHQLQNLPRHQPAHQRSVSQTEDSPRPQKRTSVNHQSIQQCRTREMD